MNSAAPPTRNRATESATSTSIQAGLYPGLAPRRIKLGQFARAALRSEHLDRLIQGAVSDVSEIQRRLIEQAAAPFGRPEAAVLFRPSALLTAPEGTLGLTARAGAPAGALDQQGQFLALDWSTLAIPAGDYPAAGALLPCLASSR